MRLPSPTKEQIRAAREKAGISLATASALIYCHRFTWAKWETGDRKMHPAFWELFLAKIGQQKLPKPPKPTA
ncbi:hypothetical protein B0G84_5718 [Paraburkholderia sp. BL8N3]|nr:helix-turn-helix transcriptional regulator [Paraburkholderia sp. BL8N3]TCK36705.1 hypothetical protein B0G84_5718 [Paraburkholderia sp. BL8N3]